MKEKFMMAMMNADEVCVTVFVYDKEVSNFIVTDCEAFTTPDDKYMMIMGDSDNSVTIDLGSEFSYDEYYEYWKVQDGALKLALSVE